MDRLKEIINKNLVAEGFEVFKRGWPDLLVVDKQNAEICAFEIKSYRDKLSKYQEELCTRLARAGIPVYIVQERANIKKNKKSKTVQFDQETEEEKGRRMQEAVNKLDFNWRTTRNHKSNPRNSGAKISKEGSR